MSTDSPALSGTLVDVRPRTLLHFLGLTGKTGVLRARVGNREAAVWLRAGAVVEVDGDVLDSVVELLRMANGRFHFDETPPPGNDPGLPVTTVLEEAGQLVRAWEETAQVVPSTTLSIELRHGDDDVRLSQDAWAVGVAVEGGHATPEAVAGLLGWGLLRTCQAVKELVERRRAALALPARPPRPMMSGPAEVVVATSPPLWPGAAAEAPGASWRTPWYDPGE